MLRLIFSCLFMLNLCQILSLKSQAQPRHRLRSNNTSLGNFEYRIFKKVDALGKKFKQFDVYFYKKGIENISVKVRFHMDAMSLPIWSSFKLKIKIITNLPQAIDNFTPQQWHKAHVPFQKPLKIYTPAYINRTYHTFSHSLLNPRQQIFKKNELKRINKHIIQTLSRNNSLNHYYSLNSDLKRWLSQENQILDMFTIEKVREKNDLCEQGTIRVSSLYDMHKKVNETFSTKNYQSTKPAQVRKLLKEANYEQQPNRSYVKLIEILLNQ